jgi:hypothetical protein
MLRSLVLINNPPLCNKLAVLGSTLQRLAFELHTNLKKGKYESNELGRKKCYVGIFKCYILVLRAACPVR